jgi:predicted ArsR family transcriptional regulator|tara:strand:- start:209 stop:430 length:222 start_codon:yes stop_codon:yes gene_type:complete
MEAIMPAKSTKTSTIIKLLRRSGGASIDQLQKAIGWQPHSIRAALTGLRKKGHHIERAKNAKGFTVYRVAKGS